MILKCLGWILWVEIILSCFSPCSRDVWTVFMSLVWTSSDRPCQRSVHSVTLTSFVWFVLNLPKLEWVKGVFFKRVFLCLFSACLRLPLLYSSVCFVFFSLGDVNAWWSESCFVGSVCIYWRNISFLVIKWSRLDILYLFNNGSSLLNKKSWNKRLELL